MHKKTSHQSELLRAGVLGKLQGTSGLVGGILVSNSISHSGFGFRIKVGAETLRSRVGGGQVGQM